MSFGYKVRSSTFGCITMGSAVLFILRSRLLLYSAGSGVNRVQVVLSGFSVRLFCFVQTKMYVGMVVCTSWLHSFDDDLEEHVSLSLNIMLLTLN